MKFNSRFQP